MKVCDCKTGFPGEPQAELETVYLLDCVFFLVT